VAGCKRRDEISGMEGYHFIQYGDGKEELFDFENDSNEKNDLANSKECTGMLKTDEIIS